MFLNQIGKVLIGFSIAIGIILLIKFVNIILYLKKRRKFVVGRYKKRYN